MEGGLFQIGLGQLKLSIGGFDVNVYKPNKYTTNVGAANDQVLFTNHRDDAQYSFWESELLSAKEDTDKYIVDISFNGKIINQEFFDYIDATNTATKTSGFDVSIIDSSLCIEQAGIMAFIGDMYALHSDFLSSIKEVQKQIIKDKIGINDEQYQEFLEHVRNCEEFSDNV